MGEPDEAELAHGHQLEAARELIGVLQEGLLQSLPLLRWEIGTNGPKHTLTGRGVDVDADRREADVRAWASALGADAAVTDVGDKVVISAAVSRGDAVVVLLIADLTE